MYKKIILITITFLLFQSVMALATTRSVSTTGTDSGDCTLSPCRTINYAISQSAEGDTISVADGTYNYFTSPTVVNKKNLKIIGNLTNPGNVVINANTISGSDKDCFQVRANNVTIQGFTLINATTQASGEGRVNAGIMVGNDENNTLIDNENCTPPSQDCLITVKTGNFSYNVMYDNSYGIYLLRASGLTMQGNTLYNNTDNNVYVNSYVYGILFTGNSIGSSTSTYGLIIEDGLGGGTGAYPKNMVVNYNSFANSNGAVGVKHYYGTLNIKYNWWGTDTGPTVGTGDPPTSGNLRMWTGMSANYTPWLTSSNPDFLISKIYAPSRTSAGATISVKDMTWNKGSDKANTFKIRFYLSADTILDVGDSSLGERSISELAGGTKSTGTTSVNIPSGTTPGMYFIIGKADADNVITENNENNNTKYRMITIGPDLQISSLIAPASASKGATINITDTTRNNGAAEAISSTTKFYLSIDKPLDSDDTLLVSRSIPVLGVRGSNTGTSTITIPSDTSPNRYYIIGKADADSNITEYNENNNVRIKAIWIAQ